MPTSILVGSGAILLPDICKASRAIVFISVPWSVPERHARRTFELAAGKLEQIAANLHIDCFRLEIDEDSVSQEWLSTIGFSQFATMGAGSLLWLEAGQVVSSEVSANSL